jgi:hypothetical protein
MCSRSFLETFGRRAFRRPLTGDELDRYVKLATDTALLLDDVWRGLEFSVVGVLESPNFLYRVELAEPDPKDPARSRYSNQEMATRLAYFLWNTTPDDALLDAAENGDLVDEERLPEHVARLLGSDKARGGALSFFSDLLDLDSLVSLEKDPAWVPLFTATVGAAMREQLLLTIDAVVFGEGGDYRDLFDTETTFVNAELANLYGLKGSFGEAFVPVTFPADGARSGVLTLAGLLTMYSGEAATSPTKRGKFVRNVLLCQDIPPPPPGVKTIIPAPAPDELVTKRDLLERHRTDPSCSSCHGFMDPIGLALENFDVLGVYRGTENGIPIDTSGDLDGMPFSDARGLGMRMREHPLLSACLVRNVYRYASGHIEQGIEMPLLEELTARFVEAGDRVSTAFEEIALSPAFRFAARAEPKETAP